MSSKYYLLFVVNQVILYVTHPFLYVKCGICYEFLCYKILFHVSASKLNEFKSVLQ